MNIFITLRTTEKARRTTEKNSAALCEAFFITRRTTENTQSTTEALCENPQWLSVLLSHITQRTTEENSAALCENPLWPSV